MPVIIIITVMLIYLGFFLYNRCIMTHKTYIAAFRGSIYDEQLADNIVGKDRYVQTALKELYGTKILAGKGLQSQVDLGKKDITVTSELFMKVPSVTLLRNQGYKNGWNIQVEKRVSILKEIDFIRDCRKIEKITGEEH